MTDGALSVPGEASPAVPFGDRLAAAVARRESQVVLGLDPDPSRLWPAAAAGGADLRARLAAALAAAAERAAGRVRAAGPSAGRAAPRLEAAAAVLAHCLAVVDAAGPAASPSSRSSRASSAWASPAGSRSRRVCDARPRARPPRARRRQARRRARHRGRLRAGAARRHADAVRPGAGLGADAITANPLLGGDALEPLIAAAAGPAPGSSPSSGRRTRARPTCFDLRAGGRPAAVGAPRRARGEPPASPGPGSGLSDVGAVCGATAPAHLERMRALMPATPFLLPGIGAQGGEVAALAAAVAPGRAGALVTASRSIVRAHEAAAGGAPPREAAPRAEA